jgi:hypothetical protein
MRRLLDNPRFSLAQFSSQGVLAALMTSIKPNQSAMLNPIPWRGR